VYGRDLAFSEKFPEKQGRHAVFFSREDGIFETLFFCGIRRISRPSGLGSGFPVRAPPDFTPFRTWIPFSHRTSSTMAVFCSETENSSNAFPKDRFAVCRLKIRHFYQRTARMGSRKIKAIRKEHRLWQEKEEFNP